MYFSKHLNTSLEAGFSNLQSGRKSGVLELRTAGIRIVPVAWYCSSSARIECLPGIGVPASCVTRLRENTKALRVRVMRVKLVAFRISDLVER